ncbi:MAG: 30S ribosomal protein S16 [Candidatus Omnitrophica bacterium]|nr:30S ribosomal protein S16 [Candidatus Omnitrophota bacterium]
MAVMIRLRKISDTSKKKYNFRIAAIEKTRSRDDRVIEELGYYDPAKDPAALKVNKERIEHWVKLGAQLSPTVKSLVKKVK